MKIKTKLRILIAVYAFLPISLFFLAGIKAEIFRQAFFQEMLVMSSAVAILLVLFGHMGGSGWLFGRQLGDIIRFCTQIRKGRYTPVQLPNESADPEAENEFVTVMRHMNWMANQIRIRQVESKNAIKALEVSEQELREARDALWGEMALAKKIQTALLTAPKNSNGFEVAASLLPADEVGGDYYDIIPSKDSLWLVIGDVSGHGIPAGLIMMMAQTAVHTALKGNVQIDPMRMLCIVNHTLTHNIKRLGESKYMTMTILRIEPDGRFSFAGLHQDILLFRAASEQIETVETEGIWLGVADDITDLQSMGHGRLEPGDALMLYTDGITEARDDQGRMFGEKPLTEALKQNGHANAECICQSVMKQMTSYALSDDMTLVVMKRKAERPITQNVTLENEIT